ncbi:putative transposase [Frigoribacterium sp. UYMn621]
MTTFCAEHGIGRSTFYELRARAREEGQAAVLAPRSRRPKTSPRSVADEVKQHAIDVRAALESSGLDHGPISVHDKMAALGLPAPSVASLARIFRQAGVARLEPRKRPRASYRRFVYPAPNACWQLDATEYVLAGGRKCVIFQLEDDHSRLAVASHVATGETSADAVIVFKKGVTARGVPQRLLTDNGAALNPSRRGWEGQLTAYVKSLGVEAITGKPYKPTTQGKNERFHQTLFRFLDKQPIAETLAQLQEQVDQFDHIYNTQRPHQGLPGRLTPQAAWDATPVADSPRPRPAGERPMVLEPATGAPGTPFALENMSAVKVKSSGAIAIRGVTYQIARELAGQTIYIAKQADGVKFFDSNGDLLLEHPWPAPGVKHVSNGRPRGAGSKRPANIRDVTGTSTDVPPGEYRRTVRADGRVSIRNIVYGIGQQHAGRELHVVIDEKTCAFWDLVTGEIIAEHPIPEHGTKHVGYARYTRKLPVFTPTDPDSDEVSAMS